MQRIAHHLAATLRWTAVAALVAVVPRVAAAQDTTLVQRRAVNRLPLNRQLVRLVIVNPGTNPPYCTASEGKLRVTVKNEGVLAVRDSLIRVQVQFGNVASPSAQLLGGKLPAGETRDFYFAMPAACWSPDCSFTIRVLSAAVARVGVRPTVYATASGHCIG